MTIVLSEEQFMKYIGEGLWTGTNHNIKNYPMMTTVSATTPDGVPNADKVGTDMKKQGYFFSNMRDISWRGN